MGKTLRELQEFSKNYILERFSHQNDIEKVFSDFLGFEIRFEDLQDNYLDYGIGVNLNLVDKDLYFDIYYLIDNENNSVITEIAFDSDYVFNDSDLEKTITPLKEDSNE
jgi:hypothetical protein